MTGPPFQIAPEHVVPWEGYPFAWRWTDPQRRALPAADLVRVRPLTTAKAGEAWHHAGTLQGAAYRDRFREVDAFAVDGRSDVHEAAAAGWLGRTLPCTPEPVFVSWTPRMAVATVRDVFVRHWASFCFPVEDVVIWPAGEGWVLLFDYRQCFYFAEARG